MWNKVQLMHSWSTTAGSTWWSGLLCQGLDHLQKLHVLLGWEQRCAYGNQVAQILSGSETWWVSPTPVRPTHTHNAYATAQNYEQGQ